MREPITKQKTYELIADQLLGEIGTRLHPGDTFPTERELTESFKVGRSSVREGLRMLESRGVIRSVGNGTFVVAELRSPLNRSLALLLSLEEGNLRELYELRRMLEGEAAALAAARRSDEDLASMAAAVEDMAQGLDDRDAYASADVRFHVAVAAATGNRVALHAMHAIRELLERALEQVYGIPGSATRSLEQHREILGAIRAGDAEEARGRMRRHLTRVEQEIHDAVKTSRLADFSTPPPLDVKE
ncbi:MAG: GntR family transcriptional regulator, transcriptional repressor for pyruvate dehydrogenase complex [Gaiellales bacterium]|jgi:GntR family transcriptional repressor for pyruvate dehydrogenase complex|nr:GntR family transcriptional regulator, transcriptional repressor for pyruvate dehydrogenase complex [Gaiellales bacterium]MDX6566472.1 GntR family transcriptional regulator, transcriptional repressor for pyruvate dehydrogenase complex [Gaiellales bacterium]